MLARRAILAGVLAACAFAGAAPLWPLTLNREAAVATAPEPPSCLGTLTH